MATRVVRLFPVVRCCMGLSAHVPFPSTAAGVRLSGPILRQTAFLHTSPAHREDDKRGKPRWPFHMSMTEEQKQEKQRKIDAANAEEAPKGVFGKVKYYLRRYWYIAVPAHAVSCIVWFGSLYAVVSSGVDVPSLLEALHLPEALVEKVRSIPQSAGVVVVALLLYKIVTPLRYLTTLGLIQGIFWTLRRMGKLRTAREVEYRVRTDYERMKMLTRRAYDQRGLGVRGFTRKKNQERMEKKNNNTETPKKEE